MNWETWLCWSTSYAAEIRTDSLSITQAHSKPDDEIRHS
jgi:hypothetical protein